MLCQKSLLIPVVRCFLSEMEGHIFSYFAYVSETVSATRKMYKESLYIVKFPTRKESILFSYEVPFSIYKYRAMIYLARSLRVGGLNIRFTISS